MKAVHVLTLVADTLAAGGPPVDIYRVEVTSHKEIAHDLLNEAQSWFCSRQISPEDLAQELSQRLDAKIYVVLHRNGVRTEVHAG